MIKKLQLRMKYTEPIFVGQRSKNEMAMSKAINLMAAKIDELVDEVNRQAKVLHGDQSS